MEVTSIRHIAELLSSLSPAQAPQTRSQLKQKRSPGPVTAAPKLTITPINNLHVDGMDEEQVWAQLELKNKSLCEVLQYALDASGEDVEMLEDDPSASINTDDGEDDLDEFDLDEDEDSEDEDEDESEDESEESEDEDLGEGVTELRDPDQEDGTLFSRISSALKTVEQPRRRRGQQSELDDGFFNLTEFNADTIRAEARKASRGSLGGDDEEEEEEEEEEIDFFNVVDNVEGDEEGENHFIGFLCD